MNRRDHTLAFIVANPGATFSEIHRATGDERTFQATSRATDRLIHDEAITKQRDGRSVRHYPAA